MFSHFSHFSPNHLFADNLLRKKEFGQKCENQKDVFFAKMLKKICFRTFLHFSPILFSKNNVLCQQTANKMRTKCEQNASKMRTKCEQNANKMRAKCEQNGKKMRTKCD